MQASGSKGCDSQWKEGQVRSTSFSGILCSLIEGAEQGEDPRSERDHSRPPQAWHARKSCLGALLGRWKGAWELGRFAAGSPAWIFSF